MPVEVKALPAPEAIEAERETPHISIHDARLPDGTPARMQRLDYSAIKPDDWPVL